MKEVITPALPHSWRLRDWPGGVYPGSADKAAYVVRAHRTELIDKGALVRIGRELVIMGAPYSAWLSDQGERVEGFTPFTSQQQSAA